jgi:hypothetical protein
VCKSVYVVLRTSSLFHNGVRYPTLSVVHEPLVWVGTFPASTRAVVVVYGHRPAESLRQVGCFVLLGEVVCV